MAAVLRASSFTRDGRQLAVVPWIGDDILIVTVEHGKASVQPLFQTPPNGRDLYFVSPLDPAGKRRMMEVEFAPGSPPRMGTPRRLFEFDPRDLAFACTPVRCLDVAPDGQRFYVVQTRTPSPPPVVTHINLVQNWFEELKAEGPTRR